MRRLALLILALALATATAVAAARLDTHGERPYDLDYVPSSRAARWLSLGHPMVAADLFWLRTVQYIGEPRAERRGWDKLFPAIDLITDLDPRHGYAYQVGGNVLASVGRVAESNAILEKGMKNLTGRYILPFQRAVNALLYEGDYARAARYFERAAATPGSPEHLREYVVAMYVKGNQADAAIAFLTHLLDTTKDAESAKALERQLQQARLERAALGLDEAIARYRERFVLPPFSVEQLVATGLIAAVPPDPYGGSWVIDDESRVHSTVNSRRFARPITAEERRAAVRALGAQTRGHAAP